jgi:hypothetical protein
MPTQVPLEPGKCDHPLPIVICKNPGLQCFADEHKRLAFHHQYTDHAPEQPDDLNEIELLSQPKPSD